MKLPMVPRRPTGALLLAASLCAAPAGAQSLPPNESPSHSIVGSGLPPNSEARGQGEEIGRELGWGNAVARNPAVGSAFSDFTKEHLLPGVYGRSGLTPKERELVIIATIVTQGAPAGLDWHYREVAPRLGISEQNLRELLYTTCFYAGWPKCSQATMELGKVLIESGARSSSSSPASK